MRSSGVDANVFAGRVNVWKVPLAIDPLDQAMKGRNVYLAGGSLHNLHQIALFIIASLPIHNHIVTTTW